ncbi:MAG: hypothetical protein ABUL46_02320, partial [Chitinophaga rupis]
MEKELLDRYFEGRASEEEQKLAAAWLAAPENKAAMLDYIEAAYTLETGQAPVAPFESLLERTQNGKKDAATV